MADAVPLTSSRGSGGESVPTGAHVGIASRNKTCSHPKMIPLGKKSPFCIIRGVASMTDRRMATQAAVAASST